MRSEDVLLRKSSCVGGVVEDERGVCMYVCVCACVCVCLVMRFGNEANEVEVEWSEVNESDCGGLNGERVLFIQRPNKVKGECKDGINERRENREKREYLAG